MLRLHNYSKQYNRQPVISADLTLPFGSYWLKGSNGAGKTTLMRSIAGQIPFRGSIIADGTDISKKPSLYRRKVNYAEAEPVFPDFLTGNELIRFYREAKGGSESQAADLIEVLGAGAYLHQKTGTYSSGMLKKLSLVLAFIGNPRLILLDEPLITLDTASVHSLTSLIDIERKKGTGLIITSHQEVVLPGSRLLPLVIEDRQLKIADTV